MRRLCLSLALCAALIATGCATSGRGGPVQRESTSGQPVAGGEKADRAPDFAVTTFEGDRFALGRQRGTPVVLNFWESW